MGNLLATRARSALLETQSRPVSAAEQTPATPTVPLCRSLKVGDYIIYKNDYYLVSGTLRKLDRVFIKKHLSGKEKNMKRAELESSCRIITDPLERKTARLAVRSKPKKSRRSKPKRGGRRVPTHRSVSQSTTAESRIARKADRVRRANARKDKRDRRGATAADVARFLSKGSYGISKISNS